jgi:hypothetical protein
MATPTAARRVLLGRRRGFSGQQRVYRTSDYLEIDDVENYDVTRRRIFYDEILWVTLHTKVAWLRAIALGLFGVLLGLLGLAFTTVSKGTAFILFCLAATLLTFVVLLFVRRLAVVTVFGKRTRAQMEFWWRADRGREAYRLVCRLARERQAQLAARQA